MDRLLTNEEMASFFKGSVMRGESVERYLFRVRDRQDEKTAAHERKEMAEWLDNNTGKRNFHWRDFSPVIDLLNEGKAPWEGE